MQQIKFSQQDFLRFSMIGNSTDAAGIKHNCWRGMEIRPLSNGALMLSYSADGWGIKELLKSLGRSNYQRLYDSLMNDSACYLTVKIFKLGSILKKRYVANVNVIFDYRQFYFGSVANKSLDQLIYHIGEALNGSYMLALSTVAAIELS